MEARNGYVFLQPDHSAPAQEEYAYGRDERSSLGVSDILQTLRRGWWMPLVGCLLGLAVGIGYITVFKTPYKSSARILIDGSINRYLQTNKIADQPMLDDTEIGSQIYVLSSDDVILPVVRSMKLASDKEFSTQSFGIGQTAEADIGVEPDSMKERNAVEAVLKRLTVSREDVANVIDVTFESPTANKAAAIANAIADTYVAIAADEKVKSTKVISQWLQDRLIELKRQIADAGQAVQQYKRAHNLAEDDIGTPSAELLSNLKIQLANAQVAVAEAKDRLDRVQKATGEGITVAMEVDALVNPSRSAPITSALNNTTIASLTAQYQELEAKIAQVESRVGPNNAAYIRLRERQDVLRAELNAEGRRISDAYENEYQLAKTREKELTASLARVSGETETSTQLQELESAADALRTLYDGVLQKYQEIDATQSKALSAPNARVITRATPPLYKSSKKPLAVFVGSLMAGLLLGVGAALGREWTADVFRTPRAVEDATALSCVALPMVESEPGLIEEHVLAAPYSRFAENLREIKALIDFSHNGNGAKVIGVMSSAPDEGKTVVATNLAALMMSASGARTLIIDGDLHRRKLSATLAPEAQQGLIEALDDPSRVAALVVKRQRSGLDILPCVANSRIPNAAELLGSPKMEQLLAAARESYDYIVIEVAPIISVVDAKRIERFLDGVIFVVEWGGTKRKLVLDTLSHAQVIRDRIIAVVLNKIDPVALRSINSYKGARSEEYCER